MIFGNIFNAFGEMPPRLAVRASYIVQMLGEVWQVGEFSRGLSYNEEGLFSMGLPIIFLF